MAFDIKLCSFTKRTNSTKRPSSYPMTLSGVLKDGCSITDPAIEVNTGLTSNTHLSYNYCYIAQFNRYYWITSWSWEAPHWIMHCSCDVLATYKTEIGASSHYVLRAASQYDTDIPDTLYPATAVRSFDSYSLTTLWDTTSYYVDFEDGTYIVGVASANAHFGSVEYYALPYTSIPTLLSALMTCIDNNVNGFKEDDATIALQRSLVDPLQFIKSCIYIPIQYSQFVLYGWADSSANTMKIFDWTISVTNRKLKEVTGRLIQQFTYANRPTHPQSSRGVWTNMSPYTRVNLWAPPFGDIDIDTSMIAGVNASLELEYTLDFITGKAVLRLHCGNLFIGKYSAQLGIPFQLSQVTRDYVNAATSLAGGIAGMFTGDWLGAAASVGNSVNNLKPRSSSVGGTGGFVDLIGDPALYYEFHHLADENITEKGRPLCKVKQLSTLSGYILCENADTAISGTQEESDAVTAYLESGFFYE